MLLFEFEGVLVDTAPLRRSVLRESLSLEGLSLSDREWSDHCHGLGTSDGVERLLTARGDTADATAAELIALRADRLFADRAVQGLSLLPGVYALLGLLAGRARLGIVTRASRRAVDFVLALAGLEHAFQCIVAAEDVRAPKPSPAPYDLAIERLQRRSPLDRTGVVALEDSGTGIQSALSAGLRCIAVGSLPVWQRMGAHASLESLEGVTPADISRLAAVRSEASG